MSSRSTARWRRCPGCGRVRRLARQAAVMCRHNRWDPAARAMVPCEGSGQPPLPRDPSGAPAALVPAGSANGGRAA